MKKILKIIFIILLIILIKLILSFSINEIIILNYNNKVYNKTLIKILYILNFNQPYISYYNEGNILYQTENYDKAIEKYNTAIEKKPPQNKICDIRINLSLATIKKINSDNYDTVFSQLEKAKNNLYNNNCAHEFDDNGYSQDAEKLEEEIKNLQNQLSDSSDSNQSNNSQENEKDNNEDYSDIEEKLKDIEKDANANRQSDLSTYENLNDYSYYSGKRW